MEKTEFPYKNFHTIGEVAQHFGINESKLRFWEKKFPELSPKRTQKGTRKYAEKDIEQIKLILHLTQEQSFKLKGANEILKDPQAASTLEVIEKLKQIKNTLLEIKANL